MTSIARAVMTVVLLTAFCCAAAGSLCAADTKDKVLAVVGKEKITQADLDAKISMLPPQFRSRYDSPEGREKLLDQTIKFCLLSQEARARGIHEQDDIAQKIEEITNNIIIQELTKQEISDKVTVSEDDLKKQYDADREKYIKPEKVKLNLIFFEAKDETSRAAKKKQAQKVLKRLKEGEDFETLAKELSEDRRTKRRGGNTGYFSRGRRVNTYGEEFEKQAFAVKPGELSDVFEAKDGYYIIKVVEKKEEHQQTFEEVQKRIERQMKQEKQKEAYDSYIDSLKKKYPVKMK